MYGRICELDWTYDLVLSVGLGGAVVMNKETGVWLKQMSVLLKMNISLKNADKKKKSANVMKHTFPPRLFFEKCVCINLKCTERY